MVATFVGANSIGQNLATLTLNVPLPVAAAAGDVCWLFCATQDTGMAATPAGWTKPTAQQDLAAGTLRHTRFWKALTSGDISTGYVTVTFAALNRVSCVTAAYSGVDTAAPEAADTPSAGVVQTTTASAVVEPAGTATAARQVISSVSERAAGVVWTQPGGETLSAQVAATGTGGTSCAVGRVSVSAGAIGGASWTHDGAASNKRAAMLVTIEDAAAVAAAVYIAVDDTEIAAGQVYYCKADLTTVRVDI